MSRIPSHVRNDIEALYKRMALRDTGNTAENAGINSAIPGGFEQRVLENVAPYAIKLDEAAGGWGGKKDRRTGQPTKGWFSNRFTSAAGMLIRNKGGLKDSIGSNTETLIEDAQDNPARQEQFLKSVSEGVKE